MIHPICQGSDCKLVTASLQKLIVCLLDQSALLTVAVEADCMFVRPVCSGDCGCRN